MPDYLVFQLYGPMTSWGDIAVGETRRSSPYPSKSAVLGMLAAAMGIDRDQERTHAQMAEAYGFAVKVISAGSLLVDYHTVQVPPRKRKLVYRTRKDELAAPKLGTLLSSREYRCDAACLVSVWVDKKPSPFSLPELAQALAQPIYTLYLGRKACPPSFHLAPMVRNYKTVKDALDSREDFEEKMAPITRRRPEIYYWDDTTHSGLNADQRIERWDLPQSRRRWQFSPRSENLMVARKET